MKKNIKIAVAMSGGVDSSVAAKILKDQGYECLGVFMRLGTSNSAESEDAARRVCRKLGMKFYPLDLRAKFKKEVKDYFLSAYKKGITPNPCVKCNQMIKFGELLKKAKSLGCEYLATGHYLKIKKVKSTRTSESSSRETLTRQEIKNKNASAESREADSAGVEYKLFRAKDNTKDQTYFLYNLTQDELKHLIFPMGEKIKKNIKAEAEKNKMPSLKGESQDVCFLSCEHNEYLKKSLKMKKGPIKNSAGEILGEHQGLPLYTIGQRKGVEIGGTGPYYVVRKDFENNTLYVTNKADDPALSAKSLIAENVNWISGAAPKFPFKCEAVIRYRHPAVPCVATPILEKERQGWVNVEFSTPQRAITPGQSVVFYKGNEVLGGGIIQ